MSNVKVRRIVQMKMYFIRCQTGKKDAHNSQINTCLPLIRHLELHQHSTTFFFTLFCFHHGNCSWFVQLQKRKGYLRSDMPPKR